MSSLNKPPRIFGLLVWLTLAVLPLDIAVGQADSLGTQWCLSADGRHEAWRAAQPWPLDSLRYAALDALGSLREQGYMHARIDSHHVSGERVRLYATRGPKALIGHIRIEGASALDSLDLLHRMETRPGGVLDAKRLESDVENLLAAYVAAGYLFAEITVGDISLSRDEAPRITVMLRVLEGRMPVLGHIETPGVRRTRASFIRRTTQLRPQRRLKGYSPDAIRERLEDSGVFGEIQEPELLLDDDGAVIVRVPLVEDPPGAFDLALGYERNDRGGGALVGSGHLELRNLFGAGRTLSLALHRAPGRVSRVDVRAADPFFLGLPVRLGGRFEGLQQDSTYGKRGYELEVGYRIEGRMQVFGTIRREVTRPGLSGLSFYEGQQRVPVATAFFAGIGVRVRRVDSSINPRRGFIVETNVEKGRKERDLRRVRAGADTTREQTRLRQDRLRARARLFIPTTRRQVMVMGGDALVLRSSELDESDLFRFGGATTLRGYDEERFRVPFAARLLFEYRYLLDAATYGFAFFDLGYVDASRTRESYRGFYPGFGVGFQLGTEVGLINFSVAANAEEPSAVRAHIGVSLGI